jgi:hypothetical protein
MRDRQIAAIANCHESRPRVSAAPNHYSPPSRQGCGAILRTVALAIA